MQVSTAVGNGDAQIGAQIQNGAIDAVATIDASAQGINHSVDDKT